MSRPPPFNGHPGLRTATLAALLMLGQAQGQAQVSDGSTSATHAAPPSEHANPIRVSGFATLGLTHNDNGSAGAISSFSQKRPVDKGWSGHLDSVAGLQLEWQPLPSTSVLLQGVARSGEDLQPRLRIAYARQQLAQGLSARVGRLRSPLYFDSDIAEIGYANLTVRPALPIYGMVNSVASLDGGDLQLRHSWGDTLLQAQVYAGGYDYGHRFNNLQPVQTADAQLRGLRGIALSAHLPDGVLRFSRTTIDRYTMRSAQVDQLNQGLDGLSAALGGLAANPMLPAPLVALLQSKAQALPGLKNPFDNRPIYTSLGWDVNVQRWRLMGELVHMDSRAALVGKYRGGTLTVARSFDDITPYVSVARQMRYGPRLDSSALAPTGLDPQLDGGLTQLRQGLDQAQLYADLSMRSVSVGVRWDWRENMALKVQLDQVRTPNAQTPGSLAVRQLPIQPKLQLLSVSLDLTF